MGKLLFCELSSKDRFNFWKKCFKMILKLSKNSKRLSFLMQFLLNFRDFLSKVPRQPTTKERAMHYIFWRERFSVLLQKRLRMTPNSSKKFNTFVFYNLCLLFESFWNQNDGKRSTKIELILLSAFKEIFADFGWKKDQNWPQKVESVKIFVNSWHFQLILIWDRNILVR